MTTRPCPAGYKDIKSGCMSVVDPQKIIPWTYDPDLKIDLWVNIYDPKTKIRYKIALNVNVSEKGLRGLNIVDLKVTHLKKKKVTR